MNSFHFPSHSNTSPYLSWKHHCYWSPFTPWLYNWSLAPGRFHRVHTNPNWFLHLDSYFYHFLPLDMSHHIMTLLLLPLLLQSKLHINTLPITHPAPNLAYLFRTLNLTHHLLNTSNPTLASDCWICLSISSPRGLALPISTDKWTHINTSVYHTYKWESLFLSYICYLYSIDQIHNPDNILTSLLTDITSTHKGPAIGGPTTSDICLQEQAPFCFSRQSSINNSYPQLGTILPHLCNHISHLSFPSGRSIMSQELQDILLLSQGDSLLHMR